MKENVTVRNIMLFTLSADDLGHVLGTGHRHALGHVLALLVSRFLREPGRNAVVVAALLELGSVVHGALGLLLSLFAVHVEHAEFQSHLQGPRVLDHLLTLAAAAAAAVAVDAAGRELQV